MGLVILAARRDCTVHHIVIVTGGGGGAPITLGLNSTFPEKHDFPQHQIIDEVLFKWEYKCWHMYPVVA